MLVLKAPLKESGVRNHRISHRSAQAQQLGGDNEMKRHQ
jgi:hypothetical protein